MTWPWTPAQPPRLTQHHYLKDIVIAAPHTQKIKIKILMLQLPAERVDTSCTTPSSVTSATPHNETDIKLGQQGASEILCRAPLVMRHPHLPRQQINQRPQPNGLTNDLKFEELQNFREIVRNSYKLSSRRQQALVTSDATASSVTRHPAKLKLSRLASICFTPSLQFLHTRLALPRELHHKKSNSKFYAQLSRYGIRTKMLANNPRQGAGAERTWPCP